MKEGENKGRRELGTEEKRDRERWKEVERERGTRRKGEREGERGEKEVE